MAYIMDGILPNGYYVGLWYDYNDHTTAFEFYKVKTKKQRDKLINKLKKQGHERDPEVEQI